jgi:hypothetical protein
MHHLKKPTGGDKSVVSQYSKFFGVVIVVGVLSASPNPGQGADTQGDAPYANHVECSTDGETGRKSCQIDLFLTRGFRAFSQCQVCHGLDGNGSSFAPSLTAKLKEIDKARFVDVVTNGYKGQIGVMPGWDKNPNVMKYMDNLYLYLLARADGVLPAGKLQRFDRKKRD